MKKDEQIITLSFFDFDQSHEYISEILNIKPTKYWLKGDAYSIDSTSRSKPLLRKESYWSYKISKKSNRYIGEFLEEFINSVVLPKVNILKTITDSC